LGHGVLATTPEDHVRVFFETVQQWDNRQGWLGIKHDEKAHFYHRW
jgi:hypothetical protein